MKKFPVFLFALAIALGCAPRARAGDAWPASEIVQKCDAAFLGSIEPSYLRILRNAIYASYGRSFASGDLKQYFSEQDWYEENPQYSDDLLSSEEKDCAGRILNIENELTAKMDALRGKTKIEKPSELPGAYLFGDLEPSTEKLLAQNGFVILPTQEEQLFVIYENNAYKRIPSFITTDAVLQLYHIFFDFSLRNIEQQHLLPALESLVVSMYDAFAEAPAGEPESVARARWANAAYFAVAADLSGVEVDLSKLPADTRKTVDAELAQVRAHQGRAKSNIFPYDVDYSQFIPRGHYTRSEELKRYFLGMMWLGNTLFALELSEQVNQNDLDYLTIRSLLIAHALNTRTHNGKPLMEIYSSIYDVSSFFVGVSDDLTPTQIYGIAKQVYGGNLNTNDFVDTGKLERVRADAKKLWNPGVRVALAGIPSGPQMRVMGQRYIPDSEMLQELTEWPVRAFPKGLDVMAVLGSDTARNLLINFYKEPDAWADYETKLNLMTQKFNKLTPDEWRQNMYYGWLWSLQAIADARVEGKVVPFFATTPAWQKKNLNTALASWAELRHDTILYGKQSGAECGDGGEFVMPPKPRGYVEPNVVFFERLEALTRLSIAGLEKFGYIKPSATDEAREDEWMNPTLSGKYSEILDIIVFLKNIAKKELEGETISEKEFDRINAIGGEFEDITKSIMGKSLHSWYEVDEADRFMAVIADVHTSQGSVLEEGVGYANEMLIIAPVNGVPRLLRGAVFSYYEFKHPASDRLTDEAWQKMLRNGEQPDPPEWMGDIMNMIFRKLPEINMNDSGC